MGGTKETFATRAWPMLGVIGVCIFGQLSATGGAARADSATAYNSAPVVSTCDQWGVNHPGAPTLNGVRLGSRLGEIKKPVDATKIEVRKFDKLPYLLVKFLSWNGPIVEAVRCDANDPIVVGLSYGETTQQTVNSMAWKSAQTADLARSTGQKVIAEESGSLRSLWSVKEARPVVGSAATDYVILERRCLLGKDQYAADCVFVSWAVIHIRSLVGALLND